MDDMFEGYVFPDSITHLKDSSPEVIAGYYAKGIVIQIVVVNHPICNRMLTLLK